MFKVGDIVECVDAAGHGDLILGASYIVADATYNNVHVLGSRFGYMSFRFRLFCEPGLPALLRRANEALT